MRECSRFAVALFFWTRGIKKSSSAHLVTFRWTWTQSLAEIHRKYVWQGHKKKKKALLQESPCSEAGIYLSLALVQPGTGCEPISLAILFAVCGLFFAPPAQSHCPCSARAQTLFLPKLSLSNLFPHWYCPRAGGPLCRDCKLQGSLCPACPLPSLLFTGKTWLDAA